MVGRSNIYLWNRDCLVVTAGKLITWKISKTKKDMGKSNQNEFVVSKHASMTNIPKWWMVMPWLPLTGHGNIHPCYTPVLPIEADEKLPLKSWRPLSHYVRWRKAVKIWVGSEDKWAARSCCLTTGQRSHHLEVPEFRLMDFLRRESTVVASTFQIFMGIWNL